MDKYTLEPGCLALVIDSVDKIAVGLTVQCIRIVGEHSKYGTIWHVRSKDQLVTQYGAVGNEADMPAIWLRKILPGDGLESKSKEKPLEHV